MNYYAEKNMLLAIWKLSNINNILKQKTMVLFDELKRFWCSIKWETG